MRHTDIVIYESYSVETANDALIKQVMLFLGPQLVWADDAIYVCRVCEDPRHQQLQEDAGCSSGAYEAEAGELGPEGVYSVVLMPVLKVTSNGSIVSDWEVHPNSGMVDEWESDDEGEEEGVSAVDLQAGARLL